VPLTHFRLAEVLMEISLANERAYQITPHVPLEVARVRVDDKRTSLVAGTVGALLARPKAEDIHLTAVENRLEPFWLVTVSARTRYDRTRTYNLHVGGPEVQQVTLLEHQVTVDHKAKGGPGITLSALEHCLDERRATRTFDGLTGEKGDFGKYLSYPSLEITNLESFVPEGVLVVAPQARATAVVRQVMGEVVQSIQAQVIHEERVDVEAMDLYFRPVYAFEYDWPAKSKKVVVEYDALTGEARPGGKRVGDELRGVLTRELLFDVTADAVGMILPGGSIAVRLVKAVVDRGK
jgi:hypothetical protein